MLVHPGGGVLDRGEGVGADGGVWGGAMVHMQSYRATIEMVGFMCCVLVVALSSGNRGPGHPGDVQWARWIRCLCLLSPSFC